jgi:hypothetical protein
MVASPGVPRKSLMVPTSSDITADTTVPKFGGTSTA